MASNSGMQTPAGYRVVNGVVEPVSWLHVIFNQSYPCRLAHMLGAPYLSVASAVGAVGAFHLLRDRGDQAARVMFSMTLWITACVTPLQIVAGDALAPDSLQYQPQKVAAMEGEWSAPSAGAGAPLVLFGIRDQRWWTSHDEIAIPHVGSLYLTHSWSGRSGPGVHFDIGYPLIPIASFAFRIMVGLGMLMVATGVVGLWLRWRGQLYTARRFQRIALAMGPAGFCVLFAVWVTTEAGHQPHTVYGMLRTAQSVSPVVASDVALSLAAFAIVDSIVPASALVFLLRLFAAAPTSREGPPPNVPQGAAGLTPGPSVRFRPWRRHSVLVGA